MEVQAEIVSNSHEEGAETEASNETLHMEQGTQYVILQSTGVPGTDGVPTTMTTMTTDEGQTEYVLVQSAMHKPENDNAMVEGTVTTEQYVRLPPGVSVVTSVGDMTAGHAGEGAATELLHLTPGVAIAGGENNTEPAREYIHLEPAQLHELHVQDTTTLCTPVVAQLPATYMAENPTHEDAQVSTEDHHEPMVTEEMETEENGPGTENEKTTLFYNMYNLPSDLCTVQMLTYSNVGNVPKMKLVTVTDVMNVSLTFKCRQCSNTFKSHKEFQEHSMTHRQDSGDAKTSGAPSAGPPKTSSQLEDVLMSIMSGAGKPAAGQDGGGDTITAVGDAETPEYVVYRLEGSENSKNATVPDRRAVTQGVPEEPLDIPVKQCTCFICKKVYDEPLLWGHYLDAHMADTFQCVVCGKKFETENILVQHMMQIHTDFKVDTTFICPVCEKQLGAHPLLLQHIIRLHPAFKEPVSPEKATEMALLKNPVVPPETRPCHECNGSGNITSQKYPCRICRKGFSDWKMLQKHMAGHVERTICTVCHKIVYAKSLAKHITLHTKAKSYKCPHCDGAYRDKCDLKKHMRIHTGEKPYTCEICSRSFAHSNQLPRHLRTHSGEKPFKCLVCQKMFSRKFGLQQHMKKHTGAKELKCVTCDIVCIDKVALKQHLLTHKKEVIIKKEEEQVSNVISAIDD